MNLINKIQNCCTTEELDVLRMEIMKSDNSNEDFEKLQKEFIRKQNMLKLSVFGKHKRKESLEKCKDCGGKGNEM